MRSVNDIVSLRQLSTAQNKDLVVEEPPRPRAVHTYRPFTIWFRAPKKLGLEGRVAVVVYAPDQAQAVTVALASGLYDYEEKANTNLFIFDGVDAGLPKDYLS